MIRLILIIYYFLIFQGLNAQKDTSSSKKTTYHNSGKGQQNNNTGKGTQNINNYFTIYNYNQALTKKQNAISATRGFFKIFKDTSSSPYVLKLGTIGSSSNGKGDLAFANDIVDPIRVTKSKGKIHIQGVLRDSKGDEYVRFYDSLWEISNIQNIEYNNDATGFEVRSGKIVIFQIDISKDTVFCNGMVCNRNGACLFFEKDKPVTFPATKLQGTARFNHKSDFNPKPLFKYPRSEFLGVREK